jgi:hypothetical protein
MLGTNSDADVDWIRQNLIYLTINLPDIIESSMKIDLTATGFGFQARAGECVYHACICILVMLMSAFSWYSNSKGISEHDYGFKLDFYEEIVPEVGLLLSTQLSLKSLPCFCPQVGN